MACLSVEVEIRKCWLHGNSKKYSFPRAIAFNGHNWTLNVTQLISRFERESCHWPDPIELWRCPVSRQTGTTSKRRQEAGVWLIPNSCQFLKLLWSLWINSVIRVLRKLLRRRRVNSSTTDAIAVPKRGRKKGYRPVVARKAKPINESKIRGEIAAH